MGESHEQLKGDCDLRKDKVVEELDAYITKLVGKNSALYQTIIGIVKAG